ncbi:MAG: MFS transporter [Candidatus Eisenbacteria bacterium]
MSPLRAAWREYVEATRAFSRPARAFLGATFLSFAGMGVSQVLFNLYLTEAGFREGFVGRVLTVTGAGVVLAALPAGWLADRWGRRRTLVLGVVLEGTAFLLRALMVRPGALYALSFAAGVGQSLYAIAAAPFLSEHSTTRERTHLFSAFFAIELVAAVAGSLIGGWLPRLLHDLPGSPVSGLFGAYRVTLVVGGAIEAASMLPLLVIGRAHEAPHRHERGAARDPQSHLIPKIGLTGFLIGAGAGLVIPFMNLYFKDRFGCSSAQIGSFFSVASLTTAIAAMIGPVVARRFGRLKTAMASQVLSLPFLVTLGAEHQLGVAVGAFWLRATLMQAATPLMMAFVMETMPPGLRARSTSLMNMLWNAGWAASATLSGILIEHAGYAVPFYVTATLYATAAAYFYLSFRHLPDVPGMAVAPVAPGPEGPASD